MLPNKCNRLLLNKNSCSIVWEALSSFSHTFLLPQLSHPSSSLTVCSSHPLSFLPTFSPLSFFPAGIDVSCRRKLWKFLYEIYPSSSTYREQRAIDLENRSQYQALCRRWEVLDKTITFPEDDISNSPSYMKLSDDEDDSNCCPSVGECKIIERTVSDPVQREELSAKSHSNGGMDSRLKSPSVGSITQKTPGAVRSKGQGGAEPVTMAADKEATCTSSSDRDCAVNGGTDIKYMTLYMYVFGKELSWVLFCAGN